MPSRTESERYGDWATKIRERETAMQPRWNDWQKYLKLYRMDFSESDLPPEDSVWLNYLFALCRVILPSIYFRNPDVLVSPRGITRQEYAAMKERLLKYQIGEIGFEREMRRVIFDCLITGTGVLKLGFGPALRKPERARSSIEAVNNLMEDFFERGNDIYGPPTETEKGTEDSFDQRISSDNPFAIRLSPVYFLCDPLATTLDDARWVCHRVLRPLDEIQSSKRYPKNLTAGIQATHLLQNQVAMNQVNAPLPGPRSLSLAQSFNNLVMLYEIWDREKDKLLVLDSWHMNNGGGSFLRSEDNPYAIDGFPFEILVFNPDPDEPFGVSDAMTWYNPTRALNMIDTMQYSHIKRFLRKYIAKKGTLIEGAEAKLTSPVDGAIVEVNGEPDNAIRPLVDAPITGDLYSLRDVLQGRLNFISGVTEQKRGVVERAKTATEASIMDEQSRIRESDRLYVVSMFVEKVLRKLLQLDEQFLDASYVAFVTGPEALMMWQNEAPQILRAEVDVKIRVGSSAFISREIRAKQLLDFLNLTSGLSEVNPLTGQPQPIINVREVIRRVAEALEIEDYKSLLATGQQPPLVPPPGPSSPSPQAPAMRTGAPNVGNELSMVQNVGARQAPNPTNPQRSR